MNGRHDFKLLVIVSVICLVLLALTMRERQEGREPFRFPSPSSTAE